MTATAVASRPADEPLVQRTDRTQEAGRGRRFGVCFAACLALFALYYASSFVNDLRGTMLADSGGKLATMRAMDAHGGLDPDVGYWAADLDPNGDLHPLTYTKRVGDAWVQASTLPMLYAAYPLYELGGTRLALVLPMLGGVAAALAARALARRYGSRDESGWAAFWLVGVATPVLLYAVSFWEHTLGLAAMLWAIVATVDMVRGTRPWSRAVVVGALFGAAATLRGEALVYAAVAAAVALVTLRRASVPWRRIGSLGAVASVAFAAVTGANYLLEQATVSGSVRVSSSSGVATAARGTADLLWDRVSAAATSLVAVNGFGLDEVAGLLTVVAMCVAVWSVCGPRRRPKVAVVAGVLACTLLIIRFASGLGYVPGLLTASPLAAVGVVAVWRSRALRPLGWLALAPLPLIWVTQYAGTQRFQWGNRYALTTGVLLVVAAVVALRGQRMALAVAVVFALLVTGFGVVFVADRTHTVADGMAFLASRPGVLVSVEPQLLREGGDFYRLDRRWLTADTADELDHAATIARRSGASTITVAAPTAILLPRVLGPYRRTTTAHVRVRPEQPLSVVEYRR